jgi:hypothetical protein
VSIPTLLRVLWWELPAKAREKTEVSRQNTEDSNWAGGAEAFGIQNTAYRYLP